MDHTIRRYVFIQSACLYLNSEHEQIIVNADKIVKYTETKCWIRAHKRYVIINHLCTSSVLHDTQVEIFFGKGKQTSYVAPPSL